SAVKRESRVQLFPYTTRFRSWAQVARIEPFWFYEQSGRMIELLLARQAPQQPAAGAVQAMQAAQVAEQAAWAVDRPSRGIARESLEQGNERCHANDNKTRQQQILVRKFGVRSAEIAAQVRNAVLLCQQDEQQGFHGVVGSYQVSWCRARRAASCTTALGSVKANRSASWAMGLLSVDNTSTASN